MRNDSDEKYDINEDDSEYHFSDDDVGYESEDAEPEIVTPKVPVEKKKFSLFSRLSQSKRVLITLGVFFVLVFIFYKMVASTGNEAPSTTINREPVSAPISEKSASPDKVLVTQKTMDEPIAVVSPPVSSPVSSPPSLPSLTASKPTVAETTTVQPSTTTPSLTPEQEVNALNQPTTTVNAPVINQSTLSTPTPVASPQPAPTTNTIPVTGAMPAESSAMTQTPTTLPVETTPPVAPAASTPTNSPVNTLYSGATSTMQQAPSSLETQEAQGVENAVIPNNQVDAMTRAVAVENEKMVSQMQANYSQRLSDYEYQNKALQSQVQSLNDRVITLESQLNQLVQVLTRSAGAGPTEARQSAPPPPQEDNSPRIGYNVQAIIPGRAWLRSDDGETVTVAEGDLLKGVGRVTKIDPYNGVVEINTGNRVISLAYGGSN